MTRRLVVAAFLLASACSEEKTPASAESIVSVWKEKGLEPTTFGEADGSKLGGGKCRSGSVASIDATLCEFGDDASAKRAEVAGLAAIGEATGVSLSSGKLLLVLVDRRTVDPSGKKINQVAKAFVERAKP